MATTRCKQCERDLIVGVAAGLCPFCLLNTGSGSDYAIVNILGRGEHGTLYLVEQQPQHRLVTVKVLSDVPDPESVIERFRRAMSVWATLSRLHIAPPLDVGLTRERRPYIIREYVRGVPITTHCERCRADRCTKQRLMASVSKIVAEAHERGMTHGGIKAANIFIVHGPDGDVPKLVDGGCRPCTPAEDIAAIHRLTAALV